MSNSANNPSSSHPGQSSAPAAASAPRAGQQAPEPLAPGDEAPSGTPGSAEGLCRTCGGSGRIEGGGTCPECEGTGKVTVGVGGG